MRTAFFLYKFKISKLLEVFFRNKLEYLNLSYEIVIGEGLLAKRFALVPKPVWSGLVKFSEVHHEKFLLEDQSQEGRDKGFRPGLIQAKELY